MKKYKLNIEADREKLRQAFEKNLPEHSSDIEVGACYGYINENEIRIFTKKASRSYKILAHDMLIAKIDESGNIEYTFKRDTKSVIFTIIAPMRRPA